MVFRLLANLPVVGTGMANVINWLALRQLGLLAYQYLGAVRGGAGTGGLLRRAKTCNQQCP